MGREREGGRWGDRRPGKAATCGASTRIDCLFLDARGAGRAILELARRGDLVELIGQWQLTPERDTDGKPVTRRLLVVRRFRVQAIPPARPRPRQRIA